MQLSDLTNVIDALDDTRNLVDAVDLMADTLNDPECGPINTMAGLISERLDEASGTLKEIAGKYRSHREGGQGARERKAA